MLWLNISYASYSPYELREIGACLIRFRIQTIIRYLLFCR